MEICFRVDWARQTVCFTEPAPRGVVRFTFHVVDFKITGDDHMAVTMTDIQKVACTITILDAKGNPASVDGIPAWTSSDAALLTVTANPDGMGATVLAVGPLGTGQVTVTADADLGAGVVPINGILDVTIVSSQATQVAIAPGVPENQ